MWNRRVSLQHTIGRRYFFKKKFPSNDLINPMLLKKHRPKDHVQVVEMAFTQRKNALTPAMLHTMQHYFLELQSNPKIKVVILQSMCETDWCIGNDFRELMEIKNTSQQDIERYFNNYNELFNTLNKLPQIFIASIAAPVRSTGLQLVSACDLAVATDKATFQLPDLEAGVFPSSVCLQLERDLGKNKALELLLTRDVLTAQQALKFGLINKVVGERQLQSETQALAEKVASLSHTILGYAKQHFYHNLTAGLLETVPNTVTVNYQNLYMPDAEEGIDAIINERKPIWVE